MTGKLLRRQLRRAFGGEGEVGVPELVERVARTGDAALADGVQRLLTLVEESYGQYERDLQLRARSLELSSAELNEANRKLSRENRAKQAAIDRLRETANQLLGETADLGAPASLEAVASLIEALVLHRRKAEENLRLMAQVFESTVEGVIITDADARILMVNRAFTEVTGYAEQEVLGGTPRILNSGRQDAAFYAAMWRSLLDHGRWQGELWNRRKNGGIFPEWLTISAVRGQSGKVSHYVAVFADITLIKESQERLQFLAHHDTLTGLPNRLMLTERLGQGLAQASRTGDRLALLFVDLDNFSAVNDTLGHPLGDQLLKAVARRLGEHLREGDTLARLGGDEFVVVLERLGAPPAAGVVAEKLLALLEQPFQIDAHELFVSASVGISVFPDDGADPHELIKNADAAMYRSKDRGRNSFHFFRPEMGQEAVERLRLQGLLRHAIEKGELELHYQPQYELQDGRLVGAEALLRWNSRELGSISPVRFIPLAEETGFIVPLGEWVLREACAQMARWRGGGLHVPLIAVNLSGKQLTRPGLPEKVKAVLEENALPPECLELEITESMLMDASSIDAVAALHALGVQLAVDDFGTGYSSLSYLKRMPVQKLKIDRSFIIDVTKDANDEAIVRAIIALAASLDLVVIAEGVENGEQARFLAREGCRQVQGYLYGRPVPAAQFQNGRLAAAPA